jgi:hypothetical protein
MAIDVCFTLQHYAALEIVPVRRNLPFAAFNAKLSPFFACKNVNEEGKLHIWTCGIFIVD